MTDLSQIQEHAEVVGSDGQHVGTVDKTENNQIKLTKNDPAAGGEHHLIPNDWIDSIENNTVRLNKSSQEVTQNWRGEPGDANDAMMQASEMAGGGSTASGGANNEQAGAMCGSSFSGTASGGGRDFDV